MEMMKAARWHKAKDIRIEQVETPGKPAAHQIKIQVKFAGICGSDLHEYSHGPMLIPVEKPYALNGHQGTTTLGHEFSGVVEEVGDQVTRFKKGDRVVVEPLFRNPDSEFIPNGKYNLSEPLGFVGLTANGGFAKYVLVEDYMVYKIPDNVSFEQGAIVEPAAVAVYAVKNTGLEIGQNCVIFGAGPIGLLCLLAAKAAGAAKVIVVDVAEKRLEKAKELGADAVISGKEADVAGKVKAANGGEGLDVFIDAAGVQVTLDAGIQSLKNGGVALIVALFGKPATINAFDLVAREITLKGVIAYRNIFPEVINLIASGKLPVEKLVTSKIILDNIVNDGFEALLNNPSQVKILVDIEKG
ncbi:2,3-butanediol dehydrogenase [Filimonas effusa]|uniref:2,3-butanediol dehydrogenase n=1 Tax=Filimonas effusa TaxID=2508721 RepID=A0A4Q1DBB1_9BACT|nr:2,3-butanediol dehydrogenase [Filimonas effusa]RXK86065.1 2,3-butanediol dehydrogenase [Filimonas effusa]